MSEGSRDSLDTIVDRLEAASIVDRRKVLEDNGKTDFLKANDTVREEIKRGDISGEGWELRRLARHLRPVKSNN